MLKLRNTERLSGEKYTEARAANKAVLEQCESYEELFEALMTATKATMRQTAVSCGMSSSQLHDLKTYTKEGAAKYCAEEILRVRKIRDFKALGHAERLEAMRRADNRDRYNYVNSLNTDELSAYVAELYAGHDDEVAHHCKYEGKRLGLLQFLNSWLNEHLIDSTAETAAITTNELETSKAEPTTEPATIIESAETQAVEKKKADLEKSPIDEAVKNMEQEDIMNSIHIKEFETIIEDLKQQEKPYWCADREQVNHTLFCAYGESREYGKRLLDFSDVIWKDDVKPIAETLRRLGVREFTISVNQGSLVSEILPAFQEEGVRIQGMTKVEAYSERMGHEVINTILMGVGEEHDA